MSTSVLLEKVTQTSDCLLFLVMNNFSSDTDNSFHKKYVPDSKKINVYYLTIPLVHIVFVTGTLWSFLFM